MGCGCVQHMEGLRVRYEVNFKCEMVGMAVQPLPRGLGWARPLDSAPLPLCSPMEDIDHGRAEPLPQPRAGRGAGGLAEAGGAGGGGAWR